jgi:hypothetical protein
MKELKKMSKIDRLLIHSFFYYQKVILFNLSNEVQKILNCNLHIDNIEEHRVSNLNFGKDNTHNLEIM